MINLVSVRSCPVCGSDQRETLYRNVSDRLFGAEGLWSFVRCAGCGLVYLDQRPSAEDVGKTYTESYAARKAARLPRLSGLQARLRRRVKSAFYAKHYGYGSVDKLTTSLLGNAPLLLPRLKRILVDGILGLRCVPGGRLLDVGCGVGVFVEQMASLGWDARGIDTDASLAEACRGRGLAVREGTLENQGFEAESFDVIVMKHVIEHVVDPAPLLRECHRILKHGGRVLLLTPNAKSLAHRLFGVHWLGLDVSRHLCVFTSETLAHIVSDAGFRVDDARSTTRISRFVALASLCSQYGENSVYRSKPPTIRRIQALLFSLRLALQIRLDQEAGDELELWATRV